MHIVFTSKIVLSHLFFIVESYFSSLLLIYKQTVNRENSTGLEHINIPSDQNFTRDYRILLYIIGMIEKMLGLWNANSFFFFLM